MSDFYARMSFLFTFLVGLLLLAPTAPAAAAPGCVGAACHGKMAAAQGCRDGAFAIRGFTLVDPDVTQPPRGDLWYSPACKAMWGELNAPEIFGFLYAQLWTQPEYGGVNVLANFFQMSNAGNYTTPMVDWQQSVKFCGSHKGVDPDMDFASGGFNACTSWR
ncbi:hypothetical protein [Micromonospora lutea]|uniref:DUF2690 domain-containing protein n=1 Tax=Micromonospora lutea TaxID=419825 RepID=A0ABQ4IUP7_9ACTN|nr:hypothetical protein [Micromonospora lutea]GIJ21646.1 hypothetical protein Vlu01_22700 [Micromonospora lutea]